jgi:hypothetical protein
VPLSLMSTLSTLFVRLGREVRPYSLKIVPGRSGSVAGSSTCSLPGLASLSALPATSALVSRKTLALFLRTGCQHQPPALNAGNRVRSRRLDESGRDVREISWPRRLTAAAKADTFTSDACACRVRLSCRKKTRSPRVFFRWCANSSDLQRGGMFGVQLRHQRSR